MGWGVTPVLSPALIDTRRYPFLADAEELARQRYGFPATKLHEFNPSILDLALERLEHAVRRARVPSPRPSLEEEVFSFYYAAILARLSGGGWLVSRLALAEANRAYDFLREERDETLAVLGRLAGIKSLQYRRGAYRAPVALVRGVPVYEQYDYQVGFVDYVVAARRLLGDPSWSPVNLPVLRGLVYLRRGQVARLVKEAITVYVAKRIESLSVEETPRLKEYVARVRDVLSRMRGRSRGGGGRVEVPKGLVVEEALPPCIAELVERARRGDNLSHQERFALATFMLNVGAEIDYVVSLFKNMPDFNEKTTRYQVEHLAGLRGSGKKYSVYSCEKMRTLGLCKAECGTRSPLQAYYRSLRRAARGASESKA